MEIGSLMDIRSWMDIGSYRHWLIRTLGQMDIRSCRDIGSWMDIRSWMDIWSWMDIGSWMDISPEK